VFTTRRGLLVGAAVLAAAGCSTPEARIIEPDPELAQTLSGAYRLAQAAEALGETDILADHNAHIATLERLLKPASLAITIDADAPADRTALAAMEAEASAQAADACLLTDTDFAVVLGEVAACRAAHAAVLA
jgi:hypothetical protein